MKPKRKLTIRRRVYKNLYRNGRRRAAHTNSAEQREGDLANEELPAGFSAATALQDLPVTLQFPLGTFDQQFERREDEQNAARRVTIIQAIPEETEERCEIQEVAEEVKSVYSGYVPTALLRRPTPSVAGELPTLRGLVKEKLPPLNEYLQKKSGRYYKKGVPKEKVEVPLAPVVVPPPEVPSNRLKRSTIPPNPGFNRAAPTYPQHRAEQRFRKRFHHEQQDKEEYEKEVKRRQIERKRRHRENRDNGPNGREVARREAERERRHRAELNKDPTFPDEIVAAPKGPIGKIPQETDTAVFKAPRPPPRLRRVKEDDAISLCCSTDDIAE